MNVWLRIQNIEEKNQYQYKETLGFKLLLGLVFLTVKPHPTEFIHIFKCFVP